MPAGEPNGRNPRRPQHAARCREHVHDGRANLNRPPQNIDELKAVLAPVSNDPSQYFLSSRDGQEFVVVWGLNLATAPPDTVVAYERTGADGKRMVVTVNRDILEVTPEEFARLKLTKDHAPGG